ncbi:DUF1266 domain-containing protein [Streptomyces sp. NBC_00249]|uniref:DUF1266 domain-containing protein n=1 Tax=Streptomyces sp. NBC_00249 TaxID=2975690 RepID=UPI0022565010|nr:DUF1266 domain-containing protein [Streptomyces sp. NBC_00249]MCX5196182.1 DUF1266 domain-containing protein [Streptomyces sp. NBC_00249]
MDGGWTAPSAIERELYEAKARGDWAAYLDTLARSQLFLAQPRARADAEPDTVRFYPTPHNALVVHTAGTLPVPTPETVYESQSLRWFAKVWAPTDPAYLAVNPGTPCEAYLTTTPADVARWRAHAETATTYGLAENRVHALFTGGPLHGPVAHGLAVGGHLAVTNREFWNALAYHGNGYQRQRERLRESWDITDRTGWLQTLEALLGARVVSPVWEYALRVRRVLASDFAGPVDVEHWRHAAEAGLRRSAELAAEPQLTPDGVTLAEPRPSAEVEGEIAGVRRLIGRIARYEQRFRADGLLPEDGWVRSALAWDQGRASQMARWGLGARYGTLEDAERGVLRAGEAARGTYRSWEEFSAGYVLGRCLHFDEEEFGDWYTGGLAAHLLLTTDPASPWVNIPWKP